MRRAKKAKAKAVYSTWRFYFMLSVLLLGFIGILWRVLHLTVIDRAFLQEQGEARMIRTIEIPAYRGAITDRHGYPLALSSPVVTIWADPKNVDLTHPALSQLANLLEIKPQLLKEMLQNNQRRGFLYLKRQVEPSVADTIKQLDMPGVHTQREYRRFYPDAEVNAHVIGFTDIDERGQEGMELAFDHLLKGVSGLRRVVKDRLGHIVEVLDEVRQARSGKDLTLSLDHNIQYVAFREIKKAKKAFNAKAASIVVLDVETGEVLAMANYPSYNPNQRPKSRGDNYRNRAVTDIFEPGSTMKAFTLARVLEEGQYTPDSMVETHPGWMVLNHRTVQDYRYLGNLTVKGVLQSSSNVGTAKLALTLPPNALWEYFRSLGFGEKTESHFPGEVAGSLQKPHKWSDFALATLSFGYGVSVTNLQLAQAYAILAADGVKHPVTLIKQQGKVNGKRVVSSDVAQQIRDMLESVVMEKKGTGRRAQIPGYRVLGKTGTVRMIGPNGYDKNRHIGMFVGAVPAEKPKLVISIVITEPEGNYYGGLVVAPVFAKVGVEALRILNIAPTIN